ncbi:L-histidine N(alpha)-methyltransferase [Oceaniserpentilla sp. 4NH20-0058]|uniref:L-histidine N(alpha)-methyltransferase n=1 Tax=Oceaniserpentilla sp. 4NH20-0058 TaxID=3127660 RepID=UPI0031021A1D
MSSQPKAQHGVFFYDFNRQQSDQKQEILQGLTQTPKRISAKYFYDQTGSELFEAITQLDEYYPTRTEVQLLKDYREAIINKAGRHSVLIEYGSGASTKIQLLLDALKPKAYVPLDISKDFLFDSAIALRQLFPWLEIHATCLDYSQPAKLPHGLPVNAKKVAFFPGSSLGNFSPNEALSFLKGVRKTVGDQGAMLIGVDLVKSDEVLNAAYNDAKGVTAQFNLNSLAHLNAIGDGNFNVDNFQHHAFFNRALSRIEMHLISKYDQVVSLFGQRLSFKKGEAITTEYSYKFEPNHFANFVQGAGFESEHCWTDKQKNFALFWLTAV